MTLGDFSRLINRAAGGDRGETLCARIAARWGADCRFCRVVGWFTEPDHCARELAARQ